MRSKRRLVVGTFSFVLFGVLAAGEARAEDEAPAAPRAFGRSGSVVLDEMLGFGFSGLGAGGPFLTGWFRYEDTKAESGGARAQTSALAFAPSLDVFIAPRLSLGGQVSAFHSSSSQMQYKTTSLGGALRPRIGWVMPITDDLAFWPRAFASISYTHSKSETPLLGAVGGLGALGGVYGGAQTTPATQSAVAWGVGVDALMAATISKTVALTFGPTIGYGKIDATTGSVPPVSSRTSVSVAVHGGIALVF